MNTETEAPEIKGYSFRDLLLDLVGICGAGLVGVGLWQIYIPAAYIGVGAILIVGAFLLGRAE